MTRWRPSRAGILNVWRFHDETFTFHEGRLLLRGPNGAGKSKALEMLLPHLLDANPPGTMHWNLVGESGDGVRAGYLWLEFQRADESFTCGVRLQASTSTTDVQASYFTTGRQVGDLLLVNDAGRPLTRVNLARAIGQHGEVHGSPAAYRAKVRTTLFPGMTEQQYESLVTALPNARGSERLDPHTLLAGVLPPLDQQDAVAGLERLERQREKLERLDDAIEVTETLIRRQRDYARQVLRDAEAELATATEQLAELPHAADEIEQQKQALTEAARSAQLLNQEAGEIDARLIGVLSGERLDELGQRLAMARTRAVNAAKHATALKARADEDAELATDAADTARTAASATQPQEAARRAGITAEEFDRQRLGAAVDARIRQISQVRRSLVQHEISVEIRDRAQARLDQERADLVQAEAAETQAAQAHEAARAKLDDDLAKWVLRCRELVVVEVTTDREQLRAEVGEAACRAREEFSREESRLEESRVALAGRLAQYTALHERLSGQMDLPPPAPHTRDADRTTASGAPLWRLVEFRPHMPPNLCAAIEAALEASGLLDAWITPDGPRLLDHDTFAEEVLTIPAPGASLLDVLVPEGHAAYRLLKGIAFGESAPDHPAAVGADGTWRLASLRGRWAKTEPTYIGAAAREQATQRRVAELTTLTDKLRADLDKLDEAKHGIAARREVLANELDDLPGHSAVDETSAVLTGAQVRCAVLRDAIVRTEQHRDHAEAQVAQAVRVLDAAVSEHALPTTEHELDEVLDAVTAFRAAGDRWLDDEREARIAEHAAETAQAHAATSREHADEAERSAVALAQEVEELGAALDSDTDPDELDRLRARRRQIDTELEDLRKHRNTLERLAEEHDADAEKRLAAIAARDVADERFRRLTSGHLPKGADGTGGEPVQDAERLLARAVENARLVLSNRVELSLGSDDDITVLTATLDRKPVDTTTLPDWLREQRHRIHEEITSTERELFDKSFARELVAERIRATDELVGELNQRLETLGVRLDWQGIGEVRDLLLSDHLTDPERDVLHGFFRERLAVEPHALDYRTWHRFVVQVARGDGWQPLTRRMHSALSGGEQAMMRCITFVAVVAAHYRADPTAPRLIPLDDVLTGLDDVHRDRLLELLVAFDLDLVLTSDQEWCDYRGLPGIGIHQLMPSDDAVTSVRFTWDGNGS